MEELRNMVSRSTLPRSFNPVSEHNNRRVPSDLRRCGENGREPRKLKAALRLLGGSGAG
jgi:hypothetical protein